ncbi:MAG: hypothetical protein HYS15_02495 [Candidatus Spechtbacteria bacterium]|nr:hypothetical protein [Candidatus Spechtbacteria bacterium]
MALDEYQQAYTHAGNSKSVLIIAGEREMEDTYPSALAIAHVLGDTKKEISLYAESPMPEHFSFLPKRYEFKKSINGSQDLTISLDVAQKPIKKIGYSTTSPHLNIHITPESGTHLEAEDLHISLSKFTYDLIITIGISDLKSLGEEFERNASFFFETLLINIDRNSANERYGQVNIIEPTLSSCSEILSSFLRKWNENLISKDVATSLLCGIIAQTHNFQNSRTKPNTLCEAAYLMTRKADRETIIKYLLKTKSFEFLKLWGIAMSKLNFRKDINFAWLTLAHQDFVESGGTYALVPSVLSELKHNFTQQASFAIFWEAENEYAALFHAPREEQLEKIKKSFGGKKLGNTILISVPAIMGNREESVVERISRELQESDVQ